MTCGGVVSIPIQVDGDSPARGEIAGPGISLTISRRHPKSPSPWNSTLMGLAVSSSTAIRSHVCPPSRVLQSSTRKGPCRSSGTSKLYSQLKFCTRMRWSGLPWYCETNPVSRFCEELGFRRFSSMASASVGVEIVSRGAVEPPSLLRSFAVLACAGEC